MWNGEILAWVIFGVVSVALLIPILAWFSPGARLRRRLRRTHNRIISRSRQPSVQLNVKTPKE